MDVPIVEYCTRGGERGIRPELIQCDGVYNVAIYNKNGEFIGRAVLTKHLKNMDGSYNIGEAVVLMDIYVYEEERGKGAADDMMEFITHAFKKIITGISTEKGRALCYKWGFKMERINDKNWLIYNKEDKECAEKTREAVAEHQDATEPEKA